MFKIMNLLNFNFFVIFFGIFIFTINGCQLKYSGIFGRKQCSLVINLNFDPFFKMSAFCLHSAVYQNLLRMNKQRMGMNPKLNAKLLMDMTMYANNNIGPKNIMQLCTQCGTQCGMQTKIKFIGDPIQGQGSLRRRGSLTLSQRRKNVFDNAIHDDADDPIYATVNRNRFRGSINRGNSFNRGGSFHSNGGSFRGGGGSFRNGGGFNGRGSLHRSNSVEQRRRAVFANERLDSDE
ncbi:Hypothetical protein SRAE_X000050900 [Strongyloides ratti]|uniref:Uncharacterized protein n=1 Tax=Strongyloides ratti TaxID=34506 RepID=A0A090LSJ3_STRRB|nr:Hypothetical protein SRAE_X000050900 [Strongyloides ratti]CEF71182.2 Hypothetical protein SRAE_X000050900 [Strongyloides ratti]